MSPARPHQGSLRFDVDARHIRQLGQELVGDRTTALAELVKNAYDADALHVTLRFSGARTSGGTLEVEDDGLGMTLDEIKRGWMRISTASKEDQPVSLKYKRQRAGRKGIGRFATETLGRKLTMRTTVSGERWAVELAFDWENDYPPGAELASIGNRYRVRTAPLREHGTILRIDGLYDRWDDAALERVRRAVRLLQPPFPVARVERGRKRADPGFAVAVEVDGELDPGSLPGYDEFLAAATAQVYAKISKTGLVTVRVASDVIDLDERTKLGKRYPGAGPFSVQASYFVYRRDALGGVGVSIAREMSAQYGGMRLYRDGLRVMPYGERGDDWLGLNKLSSSRSGALIPLAMINWFGQVAIGREHNPDLRDTASREGLVVNDAFRALQEATLNALVWAASEVGTARHRKVSTSERRPNPTRTEILEQARGEIEKALDTSLSKPAAARVSSAVARALDAAGATASRSDREEQEQVESLVDEIELLRILASLGTSIAVFSHEVRSVLITAVAALAALEGKNGTGSSQRAREAAEAVQGLQDLAGYIDAYVAASRRRERSPQPLYNVLREFEEGLAVKLAQGIEFEWRVEPRSLRTRPVARSELEAILVNLLTNAAKAMDDEGADKRVLITAEPDGKEVVIRFQDTGSGVKESIRDRIFRPFVTDTRSSVSELGIGTGLGLKIVADIAEANGGTAALAEPDDGYSTCFEIRIPRWHRQLAST
jgi:signal transduction histidine kinase